MATKQLKRGPTWSESKQCWVAWSRAERKTVYVAGKSATERERMRAWLSIEAGERRPAPKAVKTGTLGWLGAKWFGARREDADKRLIGLDHLDQCRRTISDMLKVMGADTPVADVTPDDWTRYARKIESLAATSQRRSRAIILTMFRHADDDGWIEQPMRFGRAFKQLGRTVGAARVEPFTQSQALTILAQIDLELTRVRKHCSPIPLRNLKAAFLLGINGGMTPSDLAHLKTSELDLEGGWIRHVRHKIERKERQAREQVQRVVPLWPETVRALRTAMRPNKLGLVLTTQRGRPLRTAILNDAGKVNVGDPISDGFRKVARAAGVHLAGKGLSRLRHTCRSVAGGAGDEPAADVLVGHQLPGMRRVYQAIGDDRLRAVSDHVRAWLFDPSIGV